MNQFNTIAFLILAGFCSRPLVAAEETPSIQGLIIPDTTPIVDPLATEQPGNKAPASPEEPVKPPLQSDNPQQPTMSEPSISPAAVERMISEETAQPVRPGIPNKHPFWNAYSTQGFIYAPAFDFKQVPAARTYRFTVTPKDRGAPISFEALTPWAALTPIWNKIPVGFVNLTVEGVKGGKVVGTAGTRAFYRKAVFDGTSPDAVRGYKECGELLLRNMYESDYVTYWLDHDSPDPAYGYYCYPSKMIGAVVAGLVKYSQINPAAREKSLIMARHAADYLIRTSTTKNSAYPYFPATYLGDYAAAKGKNDIIMMNYPEKVGRAYLDLYDATQEKLYFNAALNIANTYAKTQMTNGTWSLMVKPQTGEIVSKNALIPNEVLRLFRRLDKQYGNTNYRAATKMAMTWIISNPIKTFNWEGQFEDVGASAPYTNLAKGQACDIAAYMLDNADDNPQYQQWAVEILRFAEDQFVIWSRPNPNLKPVNWLTPCALEQYTWMKPINASAADLLLAWTAAYKRTGHEIFRLKAQALANAMTVSQLPDGNLPTYWDKTGDNWLNCALFAATTMIKVEEAGIHASLPHP